MIIKKGAMFGLDARIALAIFGALSVISGAALYSAIQEARKMQIIRTFDEFEKAVTSYLLDVGEDPEIHNSVVHERVTLELIESSKIGWQGPYLPFSKEGSADHYIVDSATKLKFWLYTEQNTDWGNSIGSAGTSCTAGNPCVYYLKTHLNANTSQSNELAAQLDEYYDGSDGFDKGRFRIIWFDASKTNPVAFLEMMPILSQP
ncbi:MAG TPA: hypothetical protein DCL21_02740 [Alphaproteobacteria bacterium]|nr:hypothetical protein [Alphaproteobacteria bacterium]